jgi:hypothetical protein
VPALGSRRGERPDRRAPRPTSRCPGRPSAGPLVSRLASRLSVERVPAPRAPARRLGPTARGRPPRIGQDCGRCRVRKRAPRCLPQRAGRPARCRSALRRPGAPCGLGVADPTIGESNGARDRRSRAGGGLAGGIGRRPGGLLESPPGGKSMVAAQHERCAAPQRRNPCRLQGRRPVRTARRASACRRGAVAARRSRRTAPRRAMRQSAVQLPALAPGGRRRGALTRARNGTRASRATRRAASNQHTPRRCAGRIRAVNARSAVSSTATRSEPPRPAVEDRRPSSLAPILIPVPARATR